MFKLLLGHLMMADAISQMTSVIPSTSFLPITALLYQQKSQAISAFARSPALLYQQKSQAISAFAKLPITTAKAQLTFVKLESGAPHMEHLSSALFSTVFPHTWQT